MKNPSGISSSLINMGNVFTAIGELDSALTCLKAALPHKILIGNPKGIGIVYLNLGAIYREMKKIKEAENNFDQAMVYAKESGSLDLLLEVYYNFYEMYNGAKQLDKAIFNLEKYYLIKDSMFNLGVSKQINEMQTQYESEKKDNEIKMLNQQNDAHKKEIELSSRIKLFLIVIVILVAIMAGGAIFAFINKSRDNKIISEQKRETEKQKALIEEKNKEVMDSIHYAKRIQKALITSEFYILRHLNKLRKS
jgi:tetratricopeptide (TPR) repeat protein